MSLIAMWSYEMFISMDLSINRMYQWDEVHMYVGVSSLLGIFVWWVLIIPYASMRWDAYVYLEFSNIMAWDVEFKLWHMYRWDEVHVHIRNLSGFVSIILLLVFSSMPMIWGKWEVLYLFMESLFMIFLLERIMPFEYVLCKSTSSLFRIYNPICLMLMLL